jgi:hypothetical protein
MGAENERQGSSFASAVLGAPQGITPTSPLLTTATPDRGERRRPTLTRQKREGQCRVEVPPSSAPPDDTCKSAGPARLGDMETLAALTLWLARAG